MAVTIDQFIINMHLDDVPQHVIETAKLCIMDTIGVALAGRKLSAGKIALKLAAETGGVGEAHLLGDSKGVMVPAYLAAFANSVMASCLDMDDGYYPGVGHGGSAVVPAALAVSEKVQASGKEFLEAVIVGYEICLRAGSVLNKNYCKRFFGSGAWAVYGAVAAVAKLLKLNSQEINDAMGVGMCHMPISPVMRSIHYGSMTKESIGWSALTGTVAALLASNGFTGPKVSFEDPLILYEQEKEHLVDSTWEIERVYLKPYASCRWTHAPLCALKAICEENPLSVTDVKEITVETHKNALSLNHICPDSSEAAEYSIPYALGALLCYGKVGPDQVSEDALGNPQVIDLAGKVKLVFNERLNNMVPEKRPARIEVITNTGKKYSKEVLDPKGDPGNPWTKSELVQKFISLVQPVLGLDRAEKGLVQIEKLESLDKISVLIRELIC